MVDVIFSSHFPSKVDSFKFVFLLADQPYDRTVGAIFAICLSNDVRLVVRCGRAQTGLCVSRLYVFSIADEAEYISADLVPAPGPT